jgi:hypothetical protein
VLFPSENRKNSKLDILVLKKPGGGTIKRNLWREKFASKTALPCVSFLQYVPDERGNDPSEAETLNEKY